MRVLVLNGSPHPSSGNTSFILKPFMEGMEDAGATIETFDAYCLKFMPCRACYSCWNRQNRCVKNDDANAVLEAARRADVLVLSTPLYADGISGHLKTLVERLFPILDPAFEVRGGHSRHALAEGVVRNGKIVLVSSCGLYERGNFGPAIRHIRALSENFGRQFAGALVRPAAPIYKHLLLGLKEAKSKLLAGVSDRSLPLRKRLRNRAILFGIGLAERWAKKVERAACRAGREIVSYGSVSYLTQRQVSSQFVPMRIYLRLVKMALEKKIGRSVG